MRIHIDKKNTYIGKRFGNLIVLKEKPKADKKQRKRLFCFCKCDCGNEKWIYKYSLGKYTNSCGCLKRKVHTKHNLSNIKPYKVWSNMKDRCDNNNNFSYKNYGGRGIKYDKNWSNFTNFWKDMNEGYKEGLTLDRINNDGNYCKENCRWVTRKKQNRNSRRNRYFIINNKKICLEDLSKKYGFNQSTISWRLKNGYSLKKAIKTPSNKKLNKKDIYKIRNLYKRKGISQRDIALKYGVSQSNISLIVNYETFKHLH